MWRVLRSRLGRSAHFPEARGIEPGQHASRTERQTRGPHDMPTWADHENALMRSQSSPFVGGALSVVPINFLTRIDPSLFRVLLLRHLRLGHLRLPLPPLWCLPLKAMGLPDLVPRTSMGSFWPRPGAENIAPIRSWSVGAWRGGRQVVGGDILHILARAPIFQRRAEQAWRMRWAADSAFAASVLDLRVGGAD